MLTFIEYVNHIEEGATADTLKMSIPKPLLHFLQRSVHKKKYIAAIKIYHEIMRDKSRKISKHMAITKAAGVVGLDPHELHRVLNKATRHS